MIKISLLARSHDSDKIAKIYLERGLTALQVAAELGVSRTFVLKRLHALGIKRERKNEINFPHPRPAVQAPYGLRVEKGKLVENRSEMRIARMIVEGRDRQKLSWSALCRHLNEKGVMTRNGKLWTPGTAVVVFRRWHGKV